MNRLTKKEKEIVNEFATIFNKHKSLGSTKILRLISDLFPLCKMYSFNYQDQKQKK